jgi:hypothetical protein
MPADFGIQKRILETLCHLGGIALAETILIDEVSLRMPRKVDADEVRGQLATLAAQNFVEKTKGPLGETRWRRTPSGEAAFKDLDR